MWEFFSISFLVVEIVEFLRRTKNSFAEMEFYQFEILAEEQTPSQPPASHPNRQCIIFTLFFCLAVQWLMLAH